MRFNPPPQWPVEAGWTPDENWTPDPTWPPSPPGWQFWLPDEPTEPVMPPRIPEVDDDVYRAQPIDYGTQSVRVPTARRSSALPITLTVAAVAIVAVVAALTAGFAVYRTMSRPASDSAAPANSVTAETNSATSGALRTPVSTVTETRAAAPSIITSTVLAEPAAVPGDLGLQIPMTRPACDGTGIVVFASLITPGQYARDVARALDAHPGAAYLRTDQSCPSLRQAMPNGAAIYAVYRVAGPTRGDVCAAVRAAGGDAYGKWLDTTSDPHRVIAC